MQKLKLICLLWMISPGILAQPGLSSDSAAYRLTYAKEKASEILQSYLSTYPGISIAIGMKNEIIWSQGFGLSDANSETLVTPDHQFRYYSLSKSITGLALAKLIETGQLDINSSVRIYLPDLPEAYDLIKVKHLINHTAGIRHYRKGEWLKLSSDQCETTASAINTFINDELRTPPGESHSYSSFGYVLLSHLISKITGLPYEVYVQESILDPLGIKHIALDRSESLDREVTYYSKWNGKKQKGKIAIDVNNTCKYGGGAFVGTAEALVKLYLGVLNQQVLSQKSLEQYFTAIPTDKGEPTQYAFGIGDVTNEAGIRYHGHSGSAVGAKAILLVYPDINMVMVVLCNLNDRAISQDLGKIVNLFRAVGP